MCPSPREGEVPSRDFIPSVMKSGAGVLASACGADERKRFWSTSSMRTRAFVSRRAHMKGEARLSDHDQSLGEISNRLASLPETSEFMCKLMSTASLPLDHFNSRSRFRNPGTSVCCSRRSEEQFDVPAYPNLSLNSRA
jgi:hypothetical protein